jgi:membrane-associated phospholipid phosphatase
MRVHPTLRRLYARALPHGPWDLIRQLVLFAAAYYAYRIVRGQVDGQAAVAFENARDLISIESALGTFVEPALQAANSSVSFLDSFVSWSYINLHFGLTLATLVWLYLFRNSSFYFVRNMFMIAMASALVLYVVYPTAPPRFFPEWGFEDSVANFVGFDTDTAGVSVLFNPYAAVPSMHVCFALMIGGSLALLVKHRWLKVFWALYPLWMTWVVVATGNHWWLDALFGAMVAGASALLAKQLLARARPDAWAFQPAAGVAA